MTPAERNFRRVLWLLPADYRQFWEEDMVGAYLDSAADSRRRSVGEWFAIVWLALRLRLSGSHASPRVQLWHQTAFGIAIFATLYQSLAATVWFAELVGWGIKLGFHDTSPLSQLTDWWDVGGLLLWVPTFVCLVLGRLVAARVLVLVALAHEFGITARIAAAIHPSWRPIVPNDPDPTHLLYLTWLFVPAVAVFLVPRGFRPFRGWLAAYLVPAAVMAWITVASVPDRSDIPEPTPRWLHVLQFVNVESFLHAGLIVGMIVALVRARRWLLPLAVFSGGFAAAQLLSGGWAIDTQEGGSAGWAEVNVVQLVLAVACAVVGTVVGFIGLLRDARSAREDEPGDR
jgi:hypothetical protein